MLMVVDVEQVIPEGDPEKRPQPGLRWFKMLEGLAGEESFEESLGNVFRLGVVSAEASNAGIDRIPIRRAEPFESLAGLVGFGIAGGQYRAPVRGRERTAFLGNKGRSGLFAAGKRVGTARYVRSLRESIHVYPSEGGSARADHVMSYFGARFLRLHYRMRRRLTG